MRTCITQIIKLTIVLTFLLGGINAFAQGRPHPGGPPPGGGPPPDGRPPFEQGRRGERDGRRERPPFQNGMGSNFLSSEMRFGEKTVKGSPFSAQVVVESVQTLADGTKLTKKTTGFIYRDGEGRTRREQEVGFFGPISSPDNAPRMVFINDPVSGSHYALDAENKQARKMRFSNQPPPMEPQDSVKPEAKIESLGNQTIDGVEAEGTRSVTTIPVGQIGNDRPLEVVSERWYSSALQTVVMTKYSDPRFGTTTYRLTNIKLEEPAKSLFSVPADYNIEEGNPPRGKRRPGDE
ncbi:MAG: hypothetical protein AB1757_17445 [Acidobacteriota bacterium]